MAQLPADLTLHPLGREEVALGDQVTMFHLVLVVIDPYTYESSWILETAGRLLFEFSEANCRAGWLVTADEADAKEFLGPWAERNITFCDPDRTAVKAIGLEAIPALVHIGNDLSVIGAANGWDPEAWRVVSDNLTEMMSWTRLTFPLPGDPMPFPGSPALGTPASG